MNLASVATDLGRALGAIPGLRVLPFDADMVPAPAAILGYPDVNFDATYGRGKDRWTFPVAIVVGRANDRASYAAVGKYLAGSGTYSVKAAIDDYTEATSYDSATVTAGEVDETTYGDIAHIAALFEVDVIGQGAT